jgi:hypothetical protein
MIGCFLFQQQLYQHLKLFWNWLNVDVTVAAQLAAHVVITGVSVT